MNILKMKNKINLEISGLRLEVVYNEDGVLEHIINLDAIPGTHNKMMMECYISGSGYVIEHNTSFMEMDVCNATYVKLQGYDIFIPRRIFIVDKIQ